MIDQETATDGELLKVRLEQSGATIMQATPTTWRQLVEAGWNGGAGFRALCGGESLPRDLADDVLRRVGILWNMYGPTETTIWSSLARVESGIEPICIGRPIANTDIYILDRHGEPVPIGVPGEIFIGGEGVAIGYHARPELTAQRFVADHLSGRPGARLYATGDLGKMLKRWPLRSSWPVGRPGEDTRHAHRARRNRGCARCHSRGSERHRGCTRDSHPGRGALLPTSFTGPGRTLP